MYRYFIVIAFLAAVPTGALAFSSGPVPELSLIHISEEKIISPLCVTTCRDAANPFHVGPAIPTTSGWLGSHEIR